MPRWLRHYAIPRFNRLNAVYERLSRTSCQWLEDEPSRCPLRFLPWRATTTSMSVEPGMTNKMCHGQRSAPYVESVVVEDDIVRSPVVMQPLPHASDPCDASLGMAKFMHFEILAGAFRTADRPGPKSARPGCTARRKRCCLVKVDSSHVSSCTHL